MDVDKEKGSFLRLLVIAGIGISLVLAFQNCSPVHKSGNGSLAALASCEPILKNSFQQNAHGFLQTNCANCHFFGGPGNGAFADPSLDVAFEQFNVRGAALVMDRAITNHQLPFTGPQHQGDYDAILAASTAATQEFNACVAASGGTAGGGTNNSNITDPQPTTATIFTTSKIMGAQETNPTTLTWNLSNEIAVGGVSFPGASLSIDVTLIDLGTGDLYYQFTAPTLTTGNDILRIRRLEVAFNGGSVITQATTYHALDRSVAANSTEPLSSSGMVVLELANASNTVSIAIGSLAVADAADDGLAQLGPPTFSNLISPTDTFGASCVTCHSGAMPAANLTMTNYDQVRALVIPGDPDNSPLFIRMDADLVTPMPPAGLIAPTMRARVRQWILDGALDN